MITTLATSQNWPKKTTILLLNCFQTTLQNNTIGVQDAQGTTVCTMYLEVKVQYSLECLRSVHIKNTHTHTHSLSLMWKGFWHMSLWIEFSLGECFPSGTIILCWRNKLAYCISFMNDEKVFFWKVLSFETRWHLSTHASFLTLKAPINPI
jgi:hypothetical protein